MSQGYFAGGTFFTLVALVCALLGFVEPFSAWLTTRTEVYNKICGHGEGLWTTDYWFGNDIPQLPRFSSCQDIFTQRQDSVGKYCADASSPGADSGMCEHIVWARVFSCLNLFSLCVTLILSFACYTKQKKRLPVRTRPALSVFVLSYISIVCSAVVLASMLSSPLYSERHYEALSHMYSLHVPFEGLGCRYQSPFLAKHVLYRLLQNAPLQCVLPGPGFALNLAQVIAGVFSAYLYGKQFLVLSRMKKEMQALQVNLLTREDASEQHRMSEAIYQELMAPRVYSLYGALHRRYHASRPIRYLAVHIVPALIALNVGMFVLWMIDGLRFAVTTKVKLEHLEKGTVVVDEDADIAKLLAAFGLNESQVLEELVKRLTAGGLDESAWKILELVESVFDFLPLTSFLNLWYGGAVFLSVLTLVCCYIFPIFKSIVWLWLWYIPVDELKRSRLLSWLDSLGKIAITNVFCIALITLAFRFNEVITIPIVPKLLRVDINVRVSLCPGYGTYGFVLACYSSLAIGQLLIFIHGQTTRWEEVRRTAKTNRTATYHPSSTGSSSTSTSLLDTPLPPPTRLSGLNNNFNLTTDGDANCETVEMRRASTSRSPNPVTFRPISEGHGTNTNSASASTSTTSEERQREDQEKRGRSWTTMLNATALVGPINAEKVALCNAVYNPVPGESHTFSAIGKCMMWASLGCSLVFTLIGQYSACFQYNRIGLIGHVLISEEHQLESYSVENIASQVQTIGGPDDDHGAHGLAATMFIFVLIAPIIHLTALVLLWTVPLTLRQQTLLFRAVETVIAWNALDVFLVSVLVSYKDLQTIAVTVIPLVVPELDHVARETLHFQSLYNVVPSIRFGFWWLLFGCVFEKGVTAFLIPLTATMIAERKMGMLKHQSETTDRDYHPLTAFANDTLDVDDERDISEEEHARLLQIMTPTSRYVAASAMPHILYAGFPRWAWRLGIRIGAMHRLDPGNDGY